jgi:hypothetical protein
MASKPNHQRSASALPTPAKVVPIRPKVRMRRANHPRDDGTVMIAKLAASYERSARAAEPGSEEQRLALHMAGMSMKLPRNNLRCISTPDVPPEQAFLIMLKRARVAVAEFNLIEAKFSLAMECGEDLHAWSEKRDAAVERRNQAVEDCLRTPSTKRFHLRELKASLIKDARPFGNGELWQELLAADDERLTREGRR